MSFDLENLLSVVGFLVLGTVGIALLAGWALKHLGPPQ
jgi:hypothetical protein